jgi:hypothetical protein
MKTIKAPIWRGSGSTKPDALTYVKTALTYVKTALTYV